MARVINYSGTAAELLEPGTVSTIKTYMLERVRRSRVSRLCSESMLRRLNDKVVMDFLGDQVIQLFLEVLGSKREQESVAVPATWWDHLKQSLKHKWPRPCAKFRINVRHIATSTEIRVCPHLETTSQGYHVTFAVFELPGNDITVPYDEYAQLKEFWLSKQ